MNRRGGGGCCIARYDGHGSDVGVYNRIMLKYRPIAPKPVPVGGGGGGGTTPENLEAPPRICRGKRRYVKSKNTCNGSKRVCGRKRSEKTTVLPEMMKNSPIWLSFGNNDCGGGGGVVVSSWVKVECMMDTCVVDMYGLGCTDEERMMNLQTDTCPGFISDGLNRVRWVNGSYRELIGCGAGAGEGENVTVSVCLKDDVLLRLLTQTYAAVYTCQVKVVTCDKAGKSNIMVTTPCDVWRMDSGEFAWRLDTQAALSLGRY